MPVAEKSSRALGGFVSGPPGRHRGGLRWPLAVVAVALIVVLVLPTAFVAIAEGAGALELPFNLFVVDERLPWVFRLHMLASGVALALLPAVILLRTRPRWHKPLARVAAVAVVAGALTSFPVALMSDSVPGARLGFMAQGGVWLGLLVSGVGAIRARDRQRHARLMLAMAAVSSGAIWVRLTTAVVVANRLPFEATYACVAWLGWLLPLAVVWLIAAPTGSPPRPHAKPKSVASGVR